MERVTYKIRWVLLAGIFIGGVNKQFTGTAFAIGNNAVAKYFRVTNYEVDLLSIGDTFLAIIVCLLLSIMGKLVRLRAQCLSVVLCMTISNALTAIAFSSRNLYACVVLGRVISGIAAGIFYVLPATFANKWFPPNEVATAFTVPFAGFSTGGVISSFLLPHLIPPDTSDYNETSSNVEDTAGINEVGYNFTIAFGTAAGLLAAVSLFFWIYARDGPPSPPSEAEACILASTGNENEAFSCNSGLRLSLGLLLNRPFLLLTAANFLSTSALVLFIVIMPSLIFATFPDISSSTVGYMNAAGFIASMISTLCGGRLLDKFGLYKTWSCIGTGLIIFFGAGVYVGHLHQYFVLLCILYPLMFISRSFTVTTFVEFLVEVSYPKDKTVVTSLHFAFYNLAFFVTASLQRLAFSNCGSSCAVLVPVFGNIVALGCLIFVKPNYKRSRANARRALSGSPKD